AARDRRPPARADRARLRHDRRAGEPAARGPQADGEDDEADGEGEDACAPDPAGRRRDGRCRRTAASLRDEEAEEQAQGTEVDPGGSEAQARACWLEEEPDLPR